MEVTATFVGNATTLIRGLADRIIEIERGGSVSL